MRFKFVIWIVSLIFVISCKKVFELDRNDISGTTVGGTTSKTTLSLSSFTIENVDTDSFDVSFTYQGDENNNSNVKIYYCSIKQQPGCDPLSGSSIQLTPAADKLSATIDLSSSPFTPGDLIKYKIVASDSDGLSQGGDEEGHIIIPHDGTPKMIKQLGYITMGGRNASGSEIVSDVIVDGDGNIFIAGNTTGSLGEASGGGSDVYVLKLDASGNLDASFGGGDGIAQMGSVTVGAAASGNNLVAAMSLDGSGNIFIAGKTLGSFGEESAGSWDAYVLKLSPSGALDTSFGGGDGIAQVGNVTVGAAAASNDSVSAMTIDTNGNIYVAGETFGSLGEAKAGGYDAYVLKLTSSGTLDSSFGGGDGIAQVGNVMLGAPASSNEYVYALSVDTSGNIFVAGKTDGSLGETKAGSNDAFVIKLTSAGALDTSFGGSDGIAQVGDDLLGAAAAGNDDVKAMRIDSSGNVFLAGHTFGSLGEASAGGYDAYVLKLTSAGVLDSSFGGGDGIAQIGDALAGTAASGTDYAYAIELDGSGNIFIAGYTTGALGEANAGNSDIFVIKLNSSGALDTGFAGSGISQMGNISVGSGASSSDYAYAMALDSSGNIFIGGYTSGALSETNAGNNDAYVLKLNSTGALVTSFGGGDGIVQVGGDTLGAGASGDETVAGISVDGSGNMFLAGTTNASLGEANAGNSDVIVIKLNSSGLLDTSFGGGDGIVQLGSDTIGAGASDYDYVAAISLDGSGNIFVAGYTKSSLGAANAGYNDIFVIKLDSSGVLDTSFGGGDGIAQVGTTGEDYAAALHIDGSGNIFVGGHTYLSLGETKAGSYDAFVLKLDSSGALDTSFGGNGIAQMGNVTVGAAAAGEEKVAAISVDASANVFIAGRTKGSLGEANAGSEDIFVIKLTSVGALDTSFSGDGIVQMGNSTIGAGASSIDYVSAMSVDTSGNVFVAGYTLSSLGEANGGAWDVYVLKLDSSGNLDTSFGGTDGIFQMGSVTAGTAASDSDIAGGMRLDGSGNILLVGHTSSSLGEANAGSNDVFVLKLDSSGALDTSFAGGDGIAQMGNVTAGSAALGNDNASALSLDSSGNIFITGQTYGPLGEVNSGGGDAFVLQLNATGSFP